jgi:hypothetical protein
LAVFFLLTVGSLAMAIEEPEFEVLAKHDAYEVRRYAPYLVAEVDVAGDGSDGRAFRILAGYIFGDNQESEKMQMTAPVEARAKADSEKMAMTAPVISSTRDDQSTTTYAFVMERKYTLEMLPRPNDERVRLLQRPARILAVRKYSGGWSESKFAENKRYLLDALAADNINVSGDFEWARYDSPFKPWFMRRNEIWVPVEWPADSGQGANR